MQLAGVRAKVRELLQGDVAAGKRCRQMASALYGDGVQLHLLVGLSSNQGTTREESAAPSRLQSLLLREESAARLQSLVAVFTGGRGGGRLPTGTQPRAAHPAPCPAPGFSFFHVNGSKVLRLTSSPTHHNTLPF